MERVVSEESKEGTRRREGAKEERGRIRKEEQGRG
jgi:hypothetical protein